MQTRAKYNTTNLLSSSVVVDFSSISLAPRLFCCLEVPGEDAALNGSGSLLTLVDAAESDAVGR